MAGLESHRRGTAVFWSPQPPGWLTLSGGEKGEHCTIQVDMASHSLEPELAVETTRVLPGAKLSFL